MCFLVSTVVFLRAMCIPLPENGVSGREQGTLRKAKGFGSVLCFLVCRKNAVNAHVLTPVFQRGFSVAVIINIKGIVAACWNHDGIFSVAVTNTHIWGICKPDAFPLKPQNGILELPSPSVKLLPGTVCFRTTMRRFSFHIPPCYVR